MALSASHGGLHLLGGGGPEPNSTSHPGRPETCSPGLAAFLADPPPHKAQIGIPATCLKRSRWQQGFPAGQQIILRPRHSAQPQFGSPLGGDGGATGTPDITRRDLRSTSTGCLRRVSQWVNAITQADPGKRAKHTMLCALNRPSRGESEAFCGTVQADEALPMGLGSELGSAGR